MKITQTEASYISTPSPKRLRRRWV